jgi:SAM-dependent methyltransferase
MGDLSRANPTGRFTGCASVYAQYRPDYPSAAIDFIVKHCGLTTGSLLVDIGCGTGISARLFAQRGLCVIGIEPNADMRAKAQAEESPEGVPAPEYRAGTAEATGLADSCASAVLAAQAFHWFKPEEALAEFQRILRPGGWVALMWNERDETDPFTAAYGAVIRTAPDTAAVEGPRGRAGEVLLTDERFSERECVRFHHEQVLDEEGVLGRAFSASYAPKDPARAATFANALRAVFHRFQENGRVSLRYQTSVYVGRRVDPSR